MDKSATRKIKPLLNESFKALGSTIKAAHNLAPCAVIVGTVFAIGITWVTLQWSSLMTGTASLLVVIVSLCIFAVRENFGEALLTLIGGLLTILAFEWTPERYILFMTVWFGFTFLALIISSVKIAARTEDIYRMASLRLAKPGEDYVPIEEQLKKIGRASTLQMLGPIERAEIIRVLAFRRLPIELFQPCLKAVEVLSVITKCDIKTIAIFVSDFFLSFSTEASNDSQRLVDILNGVIKDAPVPPEDFFAAFAASRRLLLSKTIAPLDFLQQLRNCLAAGVDPSDIYAEITKNSNT